MKSLVPTTVFFCCWSIVFAVASAAESATPMSLTAAAKKLDEDILAARRELAEVYQRIGDEKKERVDRSRQLEDEIDTLRRRLETFQQNQATHRRTEREARADGEHLEAMNRHVAGLCLEYRRALETRLSAAEAQDAEKALARLDKLLGDDPADIAPQTLAAMLDLSLRRCRDQLGGEKFAGEALAADGRLLSGTYMVFGPLTFFQAKDKTEETGLAVQELGSLSPSVFVDFDETEKAALQRLFDTGEACVPVDVTMGNGIRLRQTRETLPEHLRKGGITIIPLLILGGLCAVIVVVKMITVMNFPTAQCQERVMEIIRAVNDGDTTLAENLAARLRRPLRSVILEGLAHRHAAREHLEEILYEQVLAQVPALERFLTPLAVCASAAPLLGLLGTVTGMIHTFRLITVFGTGDARLLSSGISEALVTTEVGLMIAIPALLFHAYLSRRVRRTVGMTQEVAVAFVNGITLKKNDSDA